MLNSYIPIKFHIHCIDLPITDDFDEAVKLEDPGKILFHYNDISKGSRIFDGDIGIYIKKNLSN